MKKERYKRSASYFMKAFLYTEETSLDQGIEGKFPMAVTRPDAVCAVAAADWRHGIFCSALLQKER
jgi:hypothetical protein